MGGEVNTAPELRAPFVSRPPTIRRSLSPTTPTYTAMCWAAVSCISSILPAPWRRRVIRDARL